MRKGPLLATVALFLTLGAERAGVSADFPELPERSARVVNYAIQARLFPEDRRVHGEIDLVWRNTTDDAAGEAYFHLYLNAFRDKKSTLMRESKGMGKRGARWAKDYPGSVTISTFQVGGKDVPYEFVSPDDGNRDDATLARVRLPTPVAPGETATFRIVFDSKLPRVMRRTGWAGDPGKPETLFFMVAQWFPKIAVLRKGKDGKPRWNTHQFHSNTEFFSDYGVYRVSITTPANYIVGATGRRISGPVDNGDGTTTVTHEQADVHDFAWTASPHFLVVEKDWTFDSFVEEAPEEMGARIKALLARTAKHLGLEAGKVKPAGKVKVRILLQPDHADLADRFYHAAGASLACYGIWFGRYPYDVLTIVDPPSGGGAAGGMEYPTLITVWGDRTAPDYVTGMEGVTIHEFGHQYFYGLLGSNEFEEAWLDEGFTSFTDARVFEVAYGPGSTRTRYPPLHTAYFRPFSAPSMFGKVSNLLKLKKWIGKIPRPWDEPDSFVAAPGPNGLWEYVRDMPGLHFDRRIDIHAPSGERNWVLSTHSHDAMVMPGWRFASRRDYGVNAYGKPTVFLYCLRGMMGEERFDRAMRMYTAKHRFGHPTTADFFREVRAQADQKRLAMLDGFVDAIVETAARLDVAILDAGQREVAGKWIYRVTVQRRGDIPVPIDVLADGEVIGRWDSRGRETTKTFYAARDRRFQEVRIGPEWLAYLDRDVSNDARVAGGGSRKAAFVAALRWSLAIEEIVRTHAGVAR